MIPTTDNYLEWFTCAARFFFLHEGFAFLSFELHQVAEGDFPADLLRAEGNRLVGLAFVRPLAPESSADRGTFEGDAARHARMLDAPAGWLFYALPLSADALDQQLTHSKMRFAEADEVVLDENGRLVERAVIDFKALVEAVAAGRLGREISAEEAPEEFLAQAQEWPPDLYLAFNHTAKVVFALKHALV